MSAQHTPGPWTVRSYPAYGYGITAEDSPQARHSFAVVHFADTQRGRTTERAKADARLIAAAPELLEALAALMKGSEYSGDGRWGRIVMPSDAAMTAARAAIAKATGASHG
jgi:hypothetical protein